MTEPAIMIVVLMGVFVVMRVAAVRLLRQGRITPRTAALLSASRLPVVAALAWAFLGGQLLLLVLIEIPLVLLSRYRWYPRTRKPSAGPTA